MTDGDVNKRAGTAGHDEPGEWAQAVTERDVRDPAIMLD